jgi:Kef-type K+ transport system membrane component KefB
MNQEIGRTIMGAAVVDDILGLLVLSVAVGIAGGGIDALGIVLVMAKAVAFIVVGILVGLYFFSPIVVRVQVVGLKLGVRHGGFLIALAVALFYALIAETIGLSAIIGAFLAGTLFAPAPLKDEFTEGARFLGAVFTPIFFISLGLNVDIFSVLATPEIFLFTVVLIVVAMVTKVAGCAIAARMQKMSALESLAVGWGMTPRGEVGLIVAVTALGAAIIGDALFSVIVFVIIVVSVAPAPLFKQALNAARHEQRMKAAGRSQD